MSALHRFRAHLRNHMYGPVVVLIALGGTAYAATSFVGPDGQIRGCVGKTGQLTVPKPGKKCAKGTTAIAWNQKGPKGDACRSSDPNCKGPKGDACLSSDPNCKGPKGDACLSIDPNCRGPKGDTGPSTGPAGGDLTGSYPNPLIGDGKVTPAKIGPAPAVSVTKSADQPLAATSPISLSWDTELFDTANMHSGGNPGRLTAPINGLYVVDATVMFNASPNGTMRQIRVTLNGTGDTLSKQSHPLVGGENPALNLSSLVPLQANDYVELQAQGSAGAGSPALAALSSANSDKSVRFSLRWVGPPPS